MAANLRLTNEANQQCMHTYMLKWLKSPRVEINRVVTPIVVGTLAYVNPEASGITLGMFTIGMSIGRINRTLKDYAANSITAKEAALEGITAIAQYTIGVAGGCNLLTAGSVGLSIIMTGLTEVALSIQQG